MPLDHKETAELIVDDAEADDNNREDALDDLAHLALDQWPDTEKRRREAEGRPCLTVDQLNKFVNQAAMDIRGAKAGVEVIPVDSEDDVPLAGVYEGLIRQIEYQSGGEGVYAHGAESSIRCGIGHWRLETETTTDSVFDQDIKLRRVLDPLSVIWDSGASGLVREDAEHVFVTDWVHEKAFKKKYNRDGEDIDTGDFRHSSNYEFWKRDEFIRIAEYWYHVTEKRLLVLLVDGSTLDITDMDEAQIQQLRFSNMIVKARKVDAKKVRRRLMDGRDWLKDEEEWAGRFLPIIPVLGSEIGYDGKVVRKSLIRAAKDGQKLYNYFRSASAEAIGQAPKAPWLVPLTSIAGLEGYWANANRSNLPYLPYNIDPEAPTVRPQRQDPPNVPAAIWQEASLAIEDMKGATGQFDASLGSKSNETSGVAIQARQREGDAGSAVFFDNFALALQRTGTILVDLIPKIYDGDRVVRILDKGGSEQFVPINRSVQMNNGEAVLINDLSHGRFDVRVQMGAAETTARIEGREFMRDMVRSNADLMQVIGDLMFENSDFPGAQQIADRMKRIMPPQVIAEEPQEPDPMEELAVRLNLAKSQADVDKTVAQVEEIEAKTVKIAEEAEKVQAETVKTEFEAANTAREPVLVQ